MTTRICSWCDAEVNVATFCDACTKAIKEAKPAHHMSGEERAHEMTTREKLEVPFELIHKRIEDLVGRPVFTHEMGLNWAGLIEEARTREHSTFEEVIELIPEEKRVIVQIDKDLD